jgi:molybdopterin adenylyltransferase
LLQNGSRRRLALDGVPFAALSRGVCGVREKTLILNLPGSPSGAVESLEAVLDLIPHALNLLEGRRDHK